MGLLWFRRSKAKGTKPEAEQEPPPATPQRPVPLRLRGLLLLKLRPEDGIEQIETAPPLGRREEVIETLQADLPGIAFGPDGKGELATADHRIAIDVGRHRDVHAAVAEAEGDAGIELLRAVMEREGWRAYAPRAGVFIEPDALDLFALPDDAPRQSRF